MSKLDTKQLEKYVDQVESELRYMDIYNATSNVAFKMIKDGYCENNVESHRKFRQLLEDEVTDRELEREQTPGEKGVRVMLGVVIILTCLSAAAYMEMQDSVMAVKEVIEESRG